MIGFREGGDSRFGTTPTGGRAVVPLRTVANTRNGTETASGSRERREKRSAGTLLVRRTYLILEDSCGWPHAMIAVIALDFFGYGVVWDGGLRRPLGMPRDCAEQGYNSRLETVPGYRNLGRSTKGWFDGWWGRMQC